MVDAGGTEISQTMGHNFCLSVKCIVKHILQEKNVRTLSPQNYNYIYSSEEPSGPSRPSEKA